LVSEIFDLKVADTHTNKQTHRIPRYVTIRVR